MLGVEVVIQKDSVVRVFAQQLLSLCDVVGHVDEIAFEPFREPLMSASIVVQQKDPDGMSFTVNSANTEFCQQ